MRALCALLVLGLVPGILLADVIVEEESGTEFPASLTLNSGDHEFHLRAAGAGLRKRAWFKVYAACFYVERSIDLGEDPYPLAIRGDFPKRLVMQFLRDVEAEKIRGAFRDGMVKTLAEGHEAALEAFCGLFTEDLKEDDQIVLDYLPGSGLSAALAGRKLGTATDPDIIIALWATWFGKDPVSGDLKRALVGL